MEAAKRLLKRFGAAGEAARLHAAKARRDADHRAGGRWTDATLGAKLGKAPRAPDGTPSVAVRVGRHEVRIREPHFRELERLHALQGYAREGRLLSRVFCCVSRYETLFRFKGGHLSACPAEVFDALRRHFETYREAFSSPLNRSFGTTSFYSLFYDVDRFFGSRGSRGDRAEKF